VYHSFLQAPDRSGRTNGDNLKCNRQFGIEEFRLVDGVLVAGQTVSPLFDDEITGSEDQTDPSRIIDTALVFQANDPDQTTNPPAQVFIFRKPVLLYIFFCAPRLTSILILLVVMYLLSFLAFLIFYLFFAQASWGEMTYSITTGWKDGDFFEIAANGEIQVKAGNFAEIDFEALINREGIPDGVMRINVVAKDNESSATDCDIFINVVDINEPPVINHLQQNLGESLGKPFIVSSTSVAVGQTVGDQLPVKDPEETAFCRIAALDGDCTDDDREMFDITPGCQIIVKLLSSGAKLLTSPLSTFTLYVEAVDTGLSSKRNSSTAVLTSAKRVYHVKTLANVQQPVLNITGLVFSQSENTNAGVLSGQESSSTRDYSEWIGSATPTKLFVACTDNNVFQRADPTLNPQPTKSTKPCDSPTKATCEGTSSNTTNCEWRESATTKCGPRQESLRFKLLELSSATISNNPRPLVVDKVTGELSFSAAPDYEALFFDMDDSLKCDLGPPGKLLTAAKAQWCC
jgi:hypothetical protein